jgi:hypothetical protein
MYLQDLQETIGNQVTIPVLPEITTGGELHVIIAVVSKKM